MTTLVKNKGPKFGVRHMQTMLLFFGIVSLYLGRVNVSVAVVAMTNAETTNPDFDEFDWTEKEKSYILSSFYWGYCLTQFPGGLIGKKYGAKLTILLSVLVSSMLSIVTPEFVRFGGWQCFCAIRGIQGLFQGLVFPCIHQHLSNWSPDKERTRLGALSHSGIECGTVLAMLLSGVIAASSLGWPGISYVCGGISLVWCFSWLILAADFPSDSRFISSDELEFINDNQLHNDDIKKFPVPWRAIFTSTPFIAVMITRCAQAWGFTTLQTEIPSYMNGVLKMDIRSNALFSALPYLVMWIMSYVFVITADILLRKKIMSLTAVRKSFNSIAFWVPAVALVAVGFFDENHKTLAIVLMTINVGMNAGATIGSTINTMDLSPNHAGMLMAIVNSIANVVPILTPLTVGIIVTNEEDKSQWQIVFIIAAVIFAVGNLIYIIFGSAEVQPWNEPNYLKEDQENITTEPIRTLNNNQTTDNTQAANLILTSKGVGNNFKLQGIANPSYVSDQFTELNQY